MVAPAQGPSMLLTAPVNAKVSVLYVPGCVRRSFPPFSSIIKSQPVALAATPSSPLKPADAPTPFASVQVPLPATVDTLLSSVFSTRSRQLCESERNSEVPTSVGEYMLL